MRQWSCAHLGWFCDDELRRQQQAEKQRIAQAEREGRAAEAQRKADEQKLAEARRKQLEDELGRQRQADENKRREIEQRRLAEENRKRELERQKAEISSPPVITSIEGTIGTVGLNPVLKISYKDRECDVVGGHWDGPAGNERISSTFGPSGSCSGGVGIIYFQRTCHWSGTWLENITLSDAQSHKSAPYTYHYVCQEYSQPDQPVLKESTTTANVSLRSTEGTTKTSVRFVNNSNEFVNVYWKDYQGNEKFYSKIAPGQFYDQQTFVTHPWIVRGESSRKILLTIVTTKTAQVATVK